MAADRTAGACLQFCFFKQKTAYEMRISDWSSDVCSSDLLALVAAGRGLAGLREVLRRGVWPAAVAGRPHLLRADAALRQRLRDEIGRASCRERVCQYV